MKATVNENCIACGMCANVCSAVFAMGDDGCAGAVFRRGTCAAEKNVLQ